MTNQTKQQLPVELSICKRCNHHEQAHCSDAGSECASHPDSNLPVCDGALDGSNQQSEKTPVVIDRGQGVDCYYCEDGMPHTHAENGKGDV